MSYPRVNRINEEYKKVISQIIRNELKDPRISKMASVVSVDVTKDLSFATVYISVLGSEDEKKNTMEGLTKSAGYVRREVGKRVKLHHTPVIMFKEDNSIEYGVSMSQKIAEISQQKPSDQGPSEKTEDANGENENGFDDDKTE